MSQDQPQTDAEETQNDEIVGKAIRWSVAGLVAILALIALIWQLTKKPADVVVQNLEPSPLPAAREKPPLEIPQIPFIDITKSAGVEFLRINGAEGEKLLPETMGGGGAFLDFDSDGDQDLLCINSTVWPWAQDKPETPPTSALYANDGQGNFTDVTKGSGFDRELYANGVACGDYDNDGDVDVFISCVGANLLFRNDGGGKFVDVTEEAAVAGDSTAWSTSCGFFDFDNDNDLDLFVCNYVEWSREIDASMDFTLNGTLRGYGRPTDYTGAFPYLYRNDGNGKFTDVSADAGIQITDPNLAKPLSKSLGVVFCDVNTDGLLDIVVANDTVQNLLFMNKGNGRFEEVGATSGVAFDNSGGARGAMGIDAACFRNSDQLGIAIGNFATEMTALYVCQTPGDLNPVFRDEAVSNGVGPISISELKFGVLFLDADLDGRLDLFENNGHLEEDIHLVQESQQYEQSPHLLWNCGLEYQDEFVLMTEEKTGADFQKRIVGRGATMADIDGDGDLDLALFASKGPIKLLRNDQKLGHHWLRVRLKGKSGNRDAIGADVKVTLADDTVLTRTVMPTKSYQSQVELPVTFGLGANSAIKKLTVRWPGTKVDVEYPVTAVDQMLNIEQAE